MNEEQLIEELKKLGWHYVHFTGHGDIEEISEKINDEFFVVGDIEKSSILVPPDCVWEKPIKYTDYY